MTHGKDKKSKNPETASCAVGVQQVWRLQHQGTQEKCVVLSKIEGYKSKF